VPGRTNTYELVHPRCVEEARLDYEEGLELWRAGDPEEARDALRYALQACGDNLWVHVALGRIALEEFKDPALARGHFGYAVELVKRSISETFTGRLPRDRDMNRPFFEAVDGLVACLRALGRPGDADGLAAAALRWERGPKG
jgi:tetratricopeptide (TPR) repeat protein